MVDDDAFSDAVLDTVAGLISAYNKERNLRIVAEENFRMMTENAKSLRAYIDSHTTPRHGIEPQYDQSDVDAYYLSEQNRVLKAETSRLEHDVSRMIEDRDKAWTERNNLIEVNAKLLEALKSLVKEIDDYGWPTLETEEAVKAVLKEHHGER